MVCTHCGRNNPPGQYTCIGCNAVLVQQNPGTGQMPYGGGMNQMPTGGAQAPNSYNPGAPSSNTFSSSAFPTPMPTSPYASGSSSGIYVAPKKEMNKIGIAAALMYALSTLLKYITASLAYEGVSLYGSSARLIQSGDGFIVLFIAALAAVAAFSGSNKGFLGAGVVAFGFMIFQVVNYDNKARDLMKMWRDVAGSDSVKLVIDKEIGFWMLVLSATALLAVGVISVLTEKKSF